MKEKALNGNDIFYRNLNDLIFMKDSGLVHLSLYLLLKASPQPKPLLFNRQMITVERGQAITGRNEMSKETGLAPRQIRTKLELLKNIGFLTVKSTKRYSTITISNYDHFQINMPPEAPERRPAEDQSCSTFESLEAFLSSLPEFNSFSPETQGLTLRFIDEVRKVNKTGVIRQKRVSELLGCLKDIRDKTDEQSLLGTLKNIFKKDGFNFSRRDPTRPLWLEAKGYKARMAYVKVLISNYMKRKELQEAQEDEMVGMENRL